MRLGGTRRMAPSGTRPEAFIRGTSRARCSVVQVDCGERLGLDDLGELGGEGRRHGRVDVEHTDGAVLLAGDLHAADVDAGVAEDAADRPDYTGTVGVLEDEHVL